MYTNTQSNHFSSKHTKHETYPPIIMLKSALGRRLFQLIQAVSEQYRQYTKTNASLQDKLQTPTIASRQIHP